MVIKSQQTDPAQLEATELKGRLDAYREIHEHWEFADLTEAEFDDWLHEHIKSLRKRLALLLNENEAPAPSKERWGTSHVGACITATHITSREVSDVRAYLGRVRGLLRVPRSLKDKW